MPVEINDILHVLAHELRTPVGIAHGYVRLLLEDRLPSDADRRRALEQMQKALGRLSDLSHETTALAAFYEHDHGTLHSVEARTLMERVAEADYDWPVTINAEGVASGAQVRTSDPAALGRALVAAIRATARELRGETCDVIGRTHAAVFELVAGPENLLAELSAGPHAADATPVVLERGGLGLALLHAAIVLDAHGGARWTMNGKRQMLGIRLPLEERRDL